MQDEQTNGQDEPTKKRSTLARKVLPILALLLLVAVAFDYGALRGLVQEALSRRGGGSQAGRVSLGSPDETEKILAKLDLAWTNPGPPVVVFTKPG